MNLFKSHITRFAAFWGLLFSLWGCTSNQWIVDERVGIDFENGEIVGSRTIVQQAGVPDPDRPILSLELYDIDTYTYPERIVNRRYVQKYRPRPLFLIGGLVGAGAMLYLANSQSSFASNDFSERGKLILNIGGAGLTAVSLMNMEPVGEPRPTGEQRMLTKTGTHTQTDTVKTPGKVSDLATISVDFKGETIVRALKTKFFDGKIDLDLQRGFNYGIIPENDPGVISVNVRYQREDYRFDIPVETIMEKFVRIDEEGAPLRSSPTFTRGSVLTDLKVGNELKYVEAIDERWYKVLFGIAPMFVERRQSTVVWDFPSRVSEQLISGGNQPSTANVQNEVDVERDIPQAAFRDPNAFAFLIGEGSSPLKTAEEDSLISNDLDLVETYMTQTLGVPDDQIVSLRNPGRFDLLQAFNRSSAVIPDSATLYVYYRGSGEIADDRSGDTHFGLKLKHIGTRNGVLENEVVGIGELISITNRQNPGRAILLIDSGFQIADSTGALNLAEEDQKLRATVEAALPQNGTMAVILAAGLGQSANDYVSGSRNVDFRHSIFSYFLAKSLQNGDRSSDAIFNTLESNVSFTSRLLFDVPQNPILFGNPGVTVGNE